MVPFGWKPKQIEKIGCIVPHCRNSYKLWWKNQKYHTVGAIQKHHTVGTIHHVKQYRNFHSIATTQRYRLRIVVKRSNPTTSELFDWTQYVYPCSLPTLCFICKPEIYNGRYCSTHSSTWHHVLIVCAEKQWLNI